MEEPKQYKVVNDRVPIYRSWSFSLMTEEQRSDYEQFVRDEEAGRTQQEIAKLRQQPISLRIKKWANAKGIGDDPELRAFRDGKTKSLPLNYEAENKFCLPIGETILTEKQLEDLKPFVKREIKQTVKPGMMPKDKQYEGWLVVTEYNPSAEKALKEAVTKSKKKKKSGTDNK